MALCPQCQTPIDGDFGMVQCSKCGAVGFVDVNGQVQVEGGERSVSSVEPSFESSQAQAYSAMDGSPSSADGAVDFAVDPGTVGDQHAIEYSNDSEDDPSTPVFNLVSEEALAPDVSISEPEVEMPFRPQAAPPDEGSAKEDFSDVLEFANDSISQAAQGSLLFRVKISEIDTAETRRLLRENLSDSRFLWDVDELMRRIEEGVLVIDRMNAVKAAVLVQRLRDLSVQVQWEQYAINQS